MLLDQKWNIPYTRKIIIKESTYKNIKLVCPALPRIIMLNLTERHERKFILCK